MNLQRRMDTKFSLLTAWVLCFLAACSAIDVNLGEDKRLECRFDPALMNRDPTFYWIRSNLKDKDNVAIGESPLNKHYKIVFKPMEGQYDLIVTGSIYERDNGRFECRIKERGTGIDLHEQATELTVLIPPGAPQINPVSPAAIEGQQTELVCSSVGGNPDPVLRWYRKGESKPLEAVTKAGGSRSVATTSTLTLMPTKTDDGAEYRCVAWNRAIDQEDKKEATVKISVNYAPRVTVGPENPLRLERGSNAQIFCTVDAKPAVHNVRWMRSGRFIATSFNHTLRSVSLEDDGTYTCTADNGLGKVGEAELRLEVLYPPVVSVEFRREVESGASVSISCNVTSNPPATSIQWLKEGDDGFSSPGEVLRLSRVTADDAGKYVCRAVNIIGGTERVGNATVQIFVRHAPGTTRILPEDAFAVEDKSVTLSCGANPPGWPVPQYRWWRAGAETTPLSIGPEFTIAVVRQNNEGVYFCQPSNEIGSGTPASIDLKVYQAPRLLVQLPAVLQKKTGDANFNVSCSAQGKPKPSITWLKNGNDISATSQAYDITIEESEGRNGIFTVRSVLRFQGGERSMLSKLTPDDRGNYKCVFENKVRSVESELALKIEHAPIVLSHKPKAASSIGQDIVLVCRIQAYPRPNFEWIFKDALIVNDGLNYEMNVTSLSNDVYEGVLHIKETTESDYGNYYCRAANGEGEQTATIRLQPTSAPETPSSLRLVEAGYDFISLEWDEGFNGGFENTIFNVIYASHVDGTPREYDCQTSNPCLVRGLEQLQTYSFQVKALNTKGHSDLSNTLTAATVLDVSRIPEPQRVTYDPKTKIISFHADSAFSLIGFVEASEGGEDWHLAQKIAVQSPENREVLDQVNDDVEEIRLKLCLEINITLCSPAVVARPGDIIPLEATKAEFPSKYMIAIAVACVLGSLMLVLVSVFYCHRRRKAQKLEKILALEKSHSSNKLGAIERPPPPYYAGMENKTRDQNVNISTDTAKALYATHDGYGYHPSSQVPNGSDWVNMAYTENSYSNSNNGGSVNSQDSLWQVKANGDVQHEMSYNYDPIAHGGYGGFEDYSHYPQASENYLKQRSHDYGPSNGDSYAAIHKTPKHLDHLESPYHNVSGLPNPYAAHESAGENRGQPVPHSFDESLESGYSTPNSRNRRVIHEVIV